MKNAILYFVSIFYSVYLLTICLNIDYVNYFLKPLLIPSLIVYVYKQSHFTTKGILIQALVLSTLGDILLLFSDYNELFFIAGLLAFLSAHLVFIRLFLKKLHNPFPVFTGLLSSLLIGIYLYYFLSTM